MRLSNWSVRLSNCALALLLLGSLGNLGRAQQPAIQKKVKAPPKPAADSIPDGGPLTLDFIVKMLGQVKADITDEPRIVAFVNKRDLDFFATPANLNRLRTAGASADLLRLVATLKPPPLPPPPPRPVTGTIQLSCAPVECEISLDGSPGRPTQNGKLIVDGLPLKQYVVEFRKEGFLSRSERIILSAETHPDVRVTLDVSEETKTNWGRQLFKAALQAVSGTAGFTTLRSLTASGAASSWDSNGVLSEWSIKTFFRPAASVYDIGNASTGAFIVNCQGETCGEKGKSSFGKKKVSGPEAASINTNIVQYNRYHLLALFDRLNGENHKLTSSAPPTPGAAEQHLLVDNHQETYDLTLDGAMLPVSVIYKSKDGLASVRATYGQWATLESGSRYPRQISILLPGEKQHGIQVRYNTISTISK